MKNSTLTLDLRLDSAEILRAVEGGIIVGFVRERCMYLGWPVEGIISHPELELQVVCMLPEKVLETEFGSFGRAVNVFNL